MHKKPVINEGIKNPDLLYTRRSSPLPDLASPYFYIPPTAQIIVMEFMPWERPSWVQLSSQRVSLPGQPSKRTVRDGNRVRCTFAAGFFATLAPAVLGFAAAAFLGLAAAAAFLGAAFLAGAAGAAGAAAAAGLAAAGFFALGAAFLAAGFFATFFAAGFF
jgi:hypothetical protein